MKLIQGQEERWALSMTKMQIYPKSKFMTDNDIVTLAQAGEAVRCLMEYSAIQEILCFAESR